MKLLNRDHYRRWKRSVLSMSSSSRAIDRAKTSATSLETEGESDLPAFRTTNDCQN